MIIRLIIFILFLFFANNTKSQNNKIKFVEEITVSKYYDNFGNIYSNIDEVNEKTYTTRSKLIKNIRKTYYKDTIYKTIVTDYKIDDDNKVIGNTKFIIEDSISYDTHYTYHKNHIIRKESNYILNNIEVSYSETFEYKKDRIKKSTYSYSERDIELDTNIRKLLCEYTYNKRGFITISDWTKSDSSYLTNKILHKRTKKGVIVTEKEFNKDGKLVKKNKCEYKYDNHKNWTKKYCYRDKRLIKAIHRTIEYYQ